MRYRVVLFSLSACAASAVVGACTGDDPVLTDVDPCAGNACAEGGTPDGSSDSSPTGDGGPLGDGGCTGPCNGELIWLRSFGSTGGDQVLEATVDGTGNVYLLATSGGAISLGDGGTAPTISTASTFVAKLDSNGTALWAKALAGQIQQPHIAVNKDGNVFVAGTYFRNQFQTLPITWDGVDTGLSTNIGTSGYDIFALEIDSTGVRQLAIQIGADSYDEMRAIGVDHDGSLVMFGSAAAALTFRSRSIPKGPFVIELAAANFDAKWVHPIGVQNAGKVTAASIVPMEEGDVAVSGTYTGEVAFNGTFSSASTATDTFVARFKSSDGALSTTNDSFISLYGNDYAGAGSPPLTTLASSAPWEQGAHARRPVPRVGRSREHDAVLAGRRRWAHDARSRHVPGGLQ